MSHQDFVQQALHANACGHECVFYVDQNSEDFNQKVAAFRKAHVAVFTHELRKGGISQNSEGVYERTCHCGGFPQLVTYDSNVTAEE